MNLEIWQVIPTSDEENHDLFWRSLLQHSHIRLERRKTLFILEQPPFPRVVRMLSDAMTHNWRFMFVMDETNRIRTWEILKTKGSPPEFTTLVFDHVIPSMFTDDFFMALHSHSPQLTTLIFRSLKEITWLHLNQINTIHLPSLERRSIP